MPHPLPKVAAPAKRALEAQQVATLEDLAQYKEKEIADLHGMGPNALKVLKAALEEAGLDFSR